MTAADSNVDALQDAVARLLARAGPALQYVYDFGDNWGHLVEIEKPLALDSAPKHASCIAGANARPPEDVGGVDGYQRFLEIMADPDDPEHGDTKRWCGGHFDPAWFDLEIVAHDMKNALRKNARRRLHRPKPKCAGTEG